MRARGRGILRGNEQLHDLRGVRRNAFLCKGVGFVSQALRLIVGVRENWASLSQGAVISHEAFSSGLRFCFFPYGTGPAQILTHHDKKFLVFSFFPFL